MNNIRPKVAFVCVHNSCRSQMAEAISKLIATNSFEVYSAGTQIKPQINQDAVAVINELYGVDMNATQKSKLISDIPTVDIVVVHTFRANTERTGVLKTQVIRIKVNL